MQHTLRNIVALIAGLFVGSLVNMGLIMLGPSLIAPPAGVDPTQADSLAAGMSALEPKHFIVPFFAHALGTFAGALTAYLVAASYKVRLAVAIGIMFLCGGIAAAILIEGPIWFVITDLMLAYLPMAWLGIRVGERLQPEPLAAT